MAYIGALTTIGTGNIKIVMYGTQGTATLKVCRAPSNGIAFLSSLFYRRIPACLEAGTAFTVEFLQNFGTIPLMLGDPGPYKCQQGQQSPCLFFKDGLSSPFVIVSRIRQVAAPLTSRLSYWPSRLTSFAVLSHPFLSLLPLSPAPLPPPSLSTLSLTL